MWVIENPPATGLLTLGGRDAAVDQHALEAEAKPVRQYERVSQSRKLLYSVLAALCERLRARPRSG